MTGWSVAEARGRPIWEVFRVIDESTRKPVDDPALQALRERAVTRLESGALLVTRDEKELPVEHSGAPILGFDGSLAGAVLIFRDVTERRRTAQRQIDAGRRAQSPRQERARHRAVAGAGEPAPGDQPARPRPWRRPWPSACRPCTAPTISCSNRNGRARASRPWSSASSIPISARTAPRS